MQKILSAKSKKNIILNKETNSNQSAKKASDSPEHNPKSIPIDTSKSKDNILPEQKDDEIPASVDTHGLASQPETLNIKPETSEMEVHHHTHPGHHKKKWTDYFWEFLMLFLAIFADF